MNRIEPHIQGRTLDQPLVVITPHSSTHIPKELEDRIALKKEEIFKFTDLYVDELFDHVVDMGGWLISAPVSRFVVQLNKKIKQTEDGLEMDERESDGAFIKKSWTGNNVMKEPLTKDEQIEIYNNIYCPWENLLDDVVAEMQRKYGFSIVIDAHSFNSVGTNGKTKNADYILGTRDFTTADAKYILKIMDELVKPNVITPTRNVGVDLYGWNGGYTTGHYGKIADPKEMMPKWINPEKSNAIQIEVKKKIYMNETTYEKHMDFTKKDISSALERLLKLG